MKKLILGISTVVMMALSSLASAQSLATYNTTGISQGSNPTSLAATSVATNVTASAMTLGTSNASNNYFQNSFAIYNPSNLTTLAAAITANNYFSFTLTPANGKNMTVASVNLSGYFGGQYYGDATFYLEASVGNGFGSGSSNILAQWTGGDPATPGPGTITMPTTGFQGVTTAITFHIYVVEPHGYYQDAIGGGSSSQNNSIIINGSVGGTPPPVINSTLTDSGTVGASFTPYQITATNSPTSFNASNLPPGLSVNTSTGVISGTPTSSAGSPYAVSISATNSGGTGSATLTVTISSSGSSGSLATYNATGLSSGSNPTSLASTGVATNLNASAMTLGTSNATNSYFQNSFGIYNPSNITTLAGSISANNYFSFTLTPASGSSVTITNLNLGGYFGGQYYGDATFYLEASVGNGFGSGSSNILAQWSGGDPATVGPGTINMPTSGFQNMTGAITYHIYVVEPHGYYQDAIGGGSSTQNNSIVINGSVTGGSGGSAPSITSTLAASGTVNSSFSPYQITASNSPTSYGATGLPSGLSVNTGTGVISGTPTAAGTFPATISATNSHGTGSATLTITISSSGSSSPGLASIGVNLTGDWLFADAVRQANPVWNAVNSYNTTAPVNSSDWPTTDASLLVWQQNPAWTGNNDGTYLLSFTGRATITTSGSTGATVTSTPGINGTPTSTGTVDANGNTWAYINISDTSPENFEINFANTNGGVSNVHLWRPTTEGATTTLGTLSPSSPGGSTGPLFGSDTITMSKNFSTTRFMTMLDVNNSSITAWSQRTLPGAWNQNDGDGDGRNAKGLAYELAVAYCNATNTDLYLNVPVMAILDPSGLNTYGNSYYFSKLADLVKYGSDGTNPYTSAQSNPVYAGLNPGLHVYIEYGNEDWNSETFEQYSQIQNMISTDQSQNNGDWQIINYDGYAVTSTGSVAAVWRFVALQAKRLSDAFRVVYGDSAMPLTGNATVRPLIEFQAQNGQATGSVELQFMSDYYNNTDGVSHVPNPEPVNYFFWGGGGATYFNSGTYNIDSSGWGYDMATSVSQLYSYGAPNPTTYQSNQVLVNGKEVTYPISSFASVVQTDNSMAKAFGLKQVAYEGGWAINDNSNPQFAYDNVANGVATAAKNDPRAQTSQFNSQQTFLSNGGDLNVFFISSNPDPNYVWSLVTDVSNLNTPLFSAIKQIENTTPPALNTTNAISGSAPTTYSAGSQLFGNSIYGNLIAQYCWVPLVTTARNYQITINLNSSYAGQKVVVLVDGKQIGGVISSPASSVVVGTVNLSAGQHGIVVEGQYASNNSYNVSTTYNSLGSFTSLVVTPQ